MKMRGAPDNKPVHNNNNAFYRKTSVIFKAASRHFTSSSPQHRRRDEDDLQPLTAINDAPPEEREQLVVKKLQQCCTLFDFGVSENRGRDVKTATLRELVEHVKEGEHVLTESIYPNVVALVASNCFRSLPRPSERPEVVEVDEDEPAEDIQWPHLELVYQLFIDVLQSKHFDKCLAKKHISEEFLRNLLVLFDSEDVRERASLKGILHKLYGKFTAHRAFLRVQMQNIFLHHAFECEHFT